jgi:hypothetical protein
LDGDAMSAKKGLRIAGPCYELSESSFPADTEDENWFQTVSKERRAEIQIGTKRIYGNLCAVFRCDDGRVRAVTFKAFKNMKRHEDDAVVS